MPDETATSANHFARLRDEKRAERRQSSRLLLTGQYVCSKFRTKRFLVNSNRDFSDKRPVFISKPVAFGFDATLRDSKPQIKTSPRLVR